MTLTQLIAQLEAVRAQYGDCRVGRRYPDEVRDDDPVVAVIEASTRMTAAQLDDATEYLGAERNVRGVPRTPS